MPEVKRKCFVMMPFVPELHYFYLYLKQHIEQHHGIGCERADDRILTKPFLDKINDLIRDADVIIADCSGRNPNVFYELGIAHALKKDVILITKDPVGVAPSDIRHFEFIH
ncbi:nucleoside 2-deoxyribosyltransferase [candidate division KSB1 bacterium]|nr:nucleoside 2-deoxyribosyltransferase [candidate division KSB1 bacterium]